MLRVHIVIVTVGVGWFGAESNINFYIQIKEQKKQEKILKELSKKLDMESKKAERDGAKVKELDAEVTSLTKDRGEGFACYKSTTLRFVTVLLA